MAEFGDRRKRCPDCGCVVHTYGHRASGTSSKRVHYGDMAVCARVRDAEQVARLLGESFAEDGGTDEGKRAARAAYVVWRDLRSAHRRVARLKASRG